MPVQTARCSQADKLSSSCSIPQALRQFHAKWYSTPHPRTIGGPTQVLLYLRDRSATSTLKKHPLLKKRRQDYLQSPFLPPQHQRLNLSQLKCAQRPLIGMDRTTLSTHTSGRSRDDGSRRTPSQASLLSEHLHHPYSHQASSLQPLNLDLP